MIVRQLRAILVIGILWAVIWLPAGILFGLFRFWVRLDGEPPFSIVVVPYSALMWTLWGATSGVLFAIVLSLAERRGTLADLSKTRVTVWGALGAMTLPAVFFLLAAISDPDSSWIVGTALALAISAACGAMSSAATLHLARRSPAV